MNILTASTLACSFFYAVGAIICKYSMHDLQSRARLSVIELTLFLIRNKIWIFGIIITLSTNLTVLQIQSILDVSVVHSVLNSSYIFTLLLGYLFLGEVLTRNQWIGTLTVTLGTAIILFIDNPVTGQMTDLERLLGISLVSGVLISILIVIANSRLRSNYEIFYAIAAGMAFGNSQIYVKVTTNFISDETGGFSVLSIQSLSELVHVWPSLAVALFSVIGFICMQISFSHGKVSITVALIAVISRAMSTSSGYFVFGESFPLEKVIGILVILLGVFVITFASVRSNSVEVISASRA